jgi:hypothetical protein
MLHFFFSLTSEIELKLAAHTDWPWLGGEEKLDPYAIRHFRQRNSLKGTPPIFLVSRQRRPHSLLSARIYKSA